MVAGDSLSTMLAAVLETARARWGLYARQKNFYLRDLKITVMRALDAGARLGEVARKYQLSPKMLERWRSEWRAQGEMAFPGIGRRKIDLPAGDDTRRVMELERKIGQLTMENDF